jgi:hypothetical protein
MREGREGRGDTFDTSGRSQAMQEGILRRPSLEVPVAII